MELLNNKDITELALYLYEKSEDMDLQDYEETKRKDIDNLINALYYLKTCAENPYNKEYFKTLWNTLQIL